MSNKSEYQIEREKKTAINKKAMASLTTEQLEVIKKLKEDLGSALSSWQRLTICIFLTFKNLMMVITSYATTLILIIRIDKEKGQLKH